MRQKLLEKLGDEKMQGTISLTKKNFTIVIKADIE